MKTELTLRAEFEYSGPEFVCSRRNKIQEELEISMSTETIHDVRFSFCLPEPSLHTCLAKCSSRSYFKFVFPLEATPLCKLQTRHWSAIVAHKLCTWLHIGN